MQLMLVYLILFSSLFFSSTNITLDSSSKIQIYQWLPAELVLDHSPSIKIHGHPQVVDSKYGNAVEFNGFGDAIFLNQMPLKGLKQFTIEVIFFPESGGNFEQRLFHCGEITGDRVLLETRSIDENWYFDGFIKSGKEQNALIEKNYLHPLNQWYHIAYVVDNGSLLTYVNHTKELEAKINFIPIQSGKTSIGVRQNEVSWFKGLIYKIRISSDALTINEFLKY